MPSYVNVCMQSVPERQGSSIREEIGIARGGTVFAPRIIVIVYRMCASMHVSVCTLQC